MFALNALQTIKLVQVEMETVYILECALSTVSNALLTHTVLNALQVMVLTLLIQLSAWSASLTTVLLAPLLTTPLA